MAKTTREQLEVRDNFIATFEIAAKPGFYRCLLETPDGRMFWHDVGKTEGWRWGVCSLYEGHEALKTLVGQEYYSLVAGILPWERKAKKTKVDEAAVSAEADRLMGLNVE